MSIRFFTLLFLCVLNVPLLMAHDSHINHEHDGYGSYYQYKNKQEIIAHAQEIPSEFFRHASFEEIIIATQGSDKIDYDAALKHRVINRHITSDKVIPFLVRKGADVNQIILPNDVLRYDDELYLLLLDYGLDIIGIDRLFRPSFVSQIYKMMYRDGGGKPLLRAYLTMEKWKVDMNNKSDDFYATPLMQLLYMVMDDEKSQSVKYKSFSNGKVIRITKIFLSHGADINITNNDGYTAWDIYLCYLDRYNGFSYPPFEKLIKPKQTRPFSELKCRENKDKFYHNDKSNITAQY